MVRNAAMWHRFVPLPFPMLFPSPLFLGLPLVGRIQNSAQRNITKQNEAYSCILESQALFLTVIKLNGMDYPVSWALAGATWQSKLQPTLIKAIELDRIGLRTALPSGEEWIANRKNLPSSGLICKTSDARCDFASEHKFTKGIYEQVMHAKPNRILAEEAPADYRPGESSGHGPGDPPGAAVLNLRGNDPSRFGGAS